MITQQDIVVFEALKIHNLIVEPKRVRAIYTIVHSDDSEVSNELIYSYNDIYFDTAKATDVNLASMMVAQVALNYGLFCKKIIFDGLFDNQDRRFLIDMMENTSREILVNKFLSKNEFLIPPYDAIDVKTGEQYTAAEICFENTSFTHLKSEPQNTEVNTNAFAILSSGGKDSLLTYGLVKEFGEAHPVFINESGRHWFTAINSYQHFLKIEPNTAKPWCNSDRIFNWMLRQMPFIKPNFQNIRADIYPIRLWTVGVFLFGVLPVARKRKLGHILIGNEFDTTVRSSKNGLSHYNALYDQSKYFDNALTRYYKKKGWNMMQYSMLRSLSELLILKILVKRYPDLQRHQVSCHAAHKEDHIIKPCGKCEKCRRIVGMLIALNEDPRRCGYNDTQIADALKMLSESSVKQLGSDAAHLYYLLVNKESIIKNTHTEKLAKEHPQIMQLRFDNERSKLEDLPSAIRKQLIKILSSYADGISLQKDKKWHEISMRDLEFEVPYNALKN